MVADQRLRGFELGGEVVDAELLGCQQLDDPKADRVAKGTGGCGASPGGSWTPGSAAGSACVIAGADMSINIY